MELNGAKFRTKSDAELARICGLSLARAKLGKGGAAKVSWNGRLYLFDS